MKLENNLASRDNSSNDNLYIFYRKYITAANSRDFDAIAIVVADNVKLNGQVVKRVNVLAGFKE